MDKSGGGNESLTYTAPKQPKKKGIKSCTCTVSSLKEHFFSADENSKDADKLAFLNSPISIFLVFIVGMIPCFYIRN